MRTREVAQICGVTDECIRQNAKVMGVELGDRWHPHEWTDEEMKRLQAMLMKNQVTQGSMDSESIVRKVTQTALGVGLSLQEIIKSGNVALNIHQTKTSSIRPQYIELMKKHNTWKV